MIAQDLIDEANAGEKAVLTSDYERLGEQLSRRGVDIEAATARAGALALALPSWGVGTGGTRFARFPGPGEPRNVMEKIEDCGVIHQLSQLCPRVSPHFPWDETEDYDALREYAAARGLSFDAVNSNTFQDQPGQAHSYKFGSLTHTDKHVRDMAIRRNIDCIETGRRIGSRALTVWIGDGANFPGQQDFTGALERYLDSMQQIYAQLPDGWQVFIEHKLFEPAFYSTVIADWGTSILCAQTLGPKAKCLVDLGHHAPNTNIEMIVARLHQFGKLGGFHFNDSKYGDDDLDSGSIDPFRLFLVFHELVKAGDGNNGFSPAYMLDQSHNVTDPIESMITSAEAIAIAYVQALLVDQERLSALQDENDALAASQALKDAYRTDVRAIVKTARLRRGGAIDPVGVYRASEYRAGATRRRPAETGRPGGGIV